MALLKRDEEPVMQRGGGELNALLGRGSTFEGKLTFEGQVRIDGRFVGQVLTRDTLVVGEGGQVQADISAGTVIIAGHVEGTIVAAQLVQLGATARVKGNVETPMLAVDKGAQFNGALKMETVRPAAQSAAAPVVALAADLRGR
jgi:cytoskeletal protein CcmA (bactofilin family)